MHFEKYKKINENIKIDNKDLHILQELFENSRITHKELSSKLYLSRNTIDKRIKNLKKNEIFVRSIPYINFYRLGFSHYILFIEKPKLYVEKQRLELLKEIGEILEIIILYGEYNCYIRFIAKNNDQRDSILSKIISRINPIGYELTQSTHFEIVPSKRFYDTKVVIPENYIIPNDEESEVILDQIDKNIINTLSDDANQSYVEIAHKLNILPQVVISRIKKLIELRVILRFLGVITIKRIDQSFYFLRFKNREYMRNKELFEYLIMSKHVNHVDILTCEKNFFCVLNTKSQLELESFIDELLDKFKHVVSIRIELYVDRYHDRFRVNV